MSEARLTQDLDAEELQRINLELAHIFNSEPAPLSFGAARAMHDPLVVCGILGGKDVGKSTLINALAGRRVSADEREVGPGTSRPMAYVHAEMVEAVRQRLDPLGGADAIEVTPHDAAVIRNLVLVDLPDFDSEFAAHVETVRRVAPLLDRIIWVVTPRKIGDRAWVALFRDVIKDARNVHCVLNKVDELVGDDDCWPAARRRPAAAPVFAAVGSDRDLPGEPPGGVPNRDVSRLGSPSSGGYDIAQTHPDPVRSDVSATDRAAKLWHSIEAWVRDSAAYAGCPPSDEHHFLISAAYAEPDAFLRRLGTIWADPEWRRYAVDRPVIAQIAQRVRDEVQRLRAAVLGPISAAQAAVIKHANQRRELEENAARLRVHYDLEVWLTLLERACDPTYHQRVMAEAVPEEYRAQVCRRLALTRKSEVELADGLLAERVEHWPILRVVYWPLSWLARRLGRGLARAPQARASVADPFRFSARGLADHFRLLRAQIRDDHARVVQRFSLADQFPEPEQLAAHASAACETLVNDLDRQTLVGLRESYRKPSAWKRGLLWLVLLWFPLIQPVADGLLAIAGSDGALMSLRGLHQLVAVLGAGPLLRGLLLVLAIYVACLAAMYARCIRDVRQARQRPDESGPGPSGVELALLEELDRILTEEVAAPLARPVLALYERLAERTTQLAAFARLAN